MPLAKKAAAEEKIAKNKFRFAKINKTCPPASDFKQY